ncbi:Bre4p SCDLUD_003008 [Saccharomycodes ludwigii]|nr:hypothetical protein SCDLUD_003008 [Saccharomycodes ludwigii]KAH3901512.1 hypothetical protein SCDLUD_003008 [Saccharomycodes ludwigii]
MDGPIANSTNKKTAIKNNSNINITSLTFKENTLNSNSNAHTTRPSSSNIENNILTGSYTQQSFLKLSGIGKQSESSTNLPSHSHQIPPSSSVPPNNFLKLTPLTPFQRQLHDTGSKSNNISPFHSRTSFSQIKLDKLVGDTPIDYIDDYGLEELRNGFFDPIFSKHLKLPRRSHSYTSNNELNGNKKNSGLFGYFGFWNNSILNFFQIEYRNFLNHYRCIIKYFMAFFIAMVLCVIPKCGKWIGGSYRFFLVFSVLVHHPARTIGIQLEMTLWSILGSVLGLGWGSLAWFVSTCSKTIVDHQGGVLFTSLFLGVTVATFFRTKYPRLLYITISFTIVLIFTSCSHILNFHGHALEEQAAMIPNSKGYYYHYMPWKNMWDFGIAYLFGMILCLLISICILPELGGAPLIDAFNQTFQDLDNFLTAIIDPNCCNDLDTLENLKRKVIDCMNITLTESFREFSNQLKFNRFREDYLRKLRNGLTNCISPLRCIPLDNSLIFNTIDLKELKKTVSSQEKFQELEKNGRNNNENNNNINSDNTTFTSDDDQSIISTSGNPTPLPKFNSSMAPTPSDVYISVLKKHFQKPIFRLITAMSKSLELNKTLLLNKKQKNKKQECICLTNDIKRAIYNIDSAYREYTKTDFFCRELLSDTNSIKIFLFLRYLRQSAKYLVITNETLEDLLESECFTRILLPKYPLKRALNRLPKRCFVDQGAGNVLDYYQTKQDVDDAFEQIYNIYTSKHKVWEDTKGEDTKGETTKGGNNKLVYDKHTRAIDHTDFNFHTTTNRFRYKLWGLTCVLFGVEMKWALKISTIVTFICIPGWLLQSYRWYQSFQCWTGAILFCILADDRNSGTWPSLFRRSMCCLIGIFWGWCANQARHFSSPYVIVTFGSILCVVYAHNFFVYGNTKSSFTALFAFTVISLEPISSNTFKPDTAYIWKCTWVTGLSLFLCCILSIPVTWMLGSFSARTELRLAVSSLLSHVSQSYQSVTDRYLYRDIDDEPTELTLRLSNIREIRLSQSIMAIKDLLTKADIEPYYLHKFNGETYKEIIQTCEFLTEKIIQARLSGKYFRIWELDSDAHSTRALLSLRRDSVSSVIFVFYMLSNCFRSKNKLPPFLPDPILARKKLYDFLSKFEQLHQMTNDDNKKSISRTSENNADLDDYEKSHWREVHSLAFASAFTDITVGLQKLIHLSKELLGEEKTW